MINWQRVGVVVVTNSEYLQRCWKIVNRVSEAAVDIKRGKTGWKVINWLIKLVSMTMKIRLEGKLEDNIEENKQNRMNTWKHPVPT